MKLVSKILELGEGKFDENNIFIVNNLGYKEEITVSRNAWERIYHFSIEEFKRDREDFKKNKLTDHIKYVNTSYNFNKETVYLEIGCGPTYIGEYLMRTFDCYFVGVDFNYSILLTLKRYFEEKGYRKYLLIYADINNMPIKDNSVDYVYGGGVIEHLPDTEHILSVLHRVLKEGGVCFNTVPAFNLWWFLRFYNNIPSVPILKPLFEFIHCEFLKNKILAKYYGYELSYTKHQLINLHKAEGFRNTKVGSFSFHPSSDRLKNKFLREFYFRLQKHECLSAVYYVQAEK